MATNENIDGCFENDLHSTATAAQQLPHSNCRTATHPNDLAIGMNS